MKALNDLIDNYERISMLCNIVSTNFVIGELKGLKKSLKPSVHKFVADWYENHKDNLEFYIFDYIHRLDQQPNSEFKDWIDDFEIESIQILMDMHRFGYNIKEEQKYTVMVKVGSYCCNYLNKKLVSGEYFFSSKNKVKGYQTEFTKKELEIIGFGDVFNNPLFKVEEV